MPQRRRCQFKFASTRNVQKLSDYVLATACAHYADTPQQVAILRLQQRAATCVLLPADVAVIAAVLQQERQSALGV